MSETNDGPEYRQLFNIGPTVSDKAYDGPEYRQLFNIEPTVLDEASYTILHFVVFLSSRNTAWWGK